jgi:hypothetical protein
MIRRRWRIWTRIELVMFGVGRECEKVILDTGISVSVYPMWIMDMSVHRRAGHVIIDSNSCENANGYHARLNASMPTGATLDSDLNPRWYLPFLNKAYNRSHVPSNTPSAHTSALHTSDISLFPSIRIPHKNTLLEFRRPMALLWQRCT